jgi:hypothetical protein
MGLRKLKLGEGFKTVAAELKLTSDQIADVLEYCETHLLDKPEIFPVVPGLKIRCITIPKYDLNIWFGFNDSVVELLEIEDPELLN